MRYFAILEPQTLELSDIEIETLMLEKGLLVKSLVAQAVRLENNILHMTAPETIHINASEELVQEYYKFIIDLYQSQILEIKLPFIKDFEDEIYGLELADQKEKALNHFKKIYTDIYEDRLSVYDEIVSDDGVPRTRNFSKLKMLYYQLEAHKNNLSETKTSMYYLVGDRQTYIDSNFVENKIVSEILKFEAWKQIIVELNSRYGFEEDYYFTNKIKDDVNINKLEFKTKKSDFKPSNPQNNPTPFIDLIRHTNKLEIELIIKTHYSDLRGVSLRYLIEFLIDKQILLINHGDKTKIYKSLKTLFNNEDIGSPSSIFDLKIDREKDHKYLNAKNNFLNKFEKII
jgi:hypothetical protein